MATREQQPSEAQQEELRDHSTGDLVKQLSSQVSALVRQEVELAKVEMAEKGKKAGVGLGMFGGAGVAALLGLGSLTAFLILVLHQAIPAWPAWWPFRRARRSKKSEHPFPSKPQRASRRTSNG